MFEKLTDLLLEFLFYLLVVAVVALITVFFYTGWRTGQVRDQHLRACHALGAEYHYWLDRHQCVKYVQTP